MMEQRQNHAIAGIFVYLLLGVFAVMSVILVLLGIRAYNSTAETNAAHTEERILTNYVRTRIRSSDLVGNVIAETVDGIDTLTFREEWDGEVYLTRIYWYDGNLMELFTEVDQPFAPEDGEVLAKAKAFVPKVENGVAEFTVTDGSDRTERAVTALIY